MLLINKEEVIKKIISKKYSKILFQGPDGLRNQLLNLAYELRRELSDVEIIVDADRNFGACDIPYDKAVKLNVDAIFHFGHTEFPATREQLSLIKKRIPVEYFPTYEDSSMDKSIIFKIKTMLGNVDKVAVTYSIQYLKQYEWLVKELLREGVNIYNRKISADIDSWRIIGCNIGILGKIKEKINAIIVVSSGLFHALGIGLYTGLPTILVDVGRMDVVNIDREIIRYRSLIINNIEKARDADRFAVIVSTKSFQFNLSTAIYINRYLRDMLRKNSALLIMDHINPEKLEYFPSIDVFIQTACPRISIDDIINYKKPILNIEQFLILVGKKEFEEVYPWREPRLSQV